MRNERKKNWSKFSMKKMTFFFRFCVVDFVYFFFWLEMIIPQQHRYWFEYHSLSFSSILFIWTKTKDQNQFKIQTNKNNNQGVVWYVWNVIQKKIATTTITTRNEMKSHPSNPKYNHHRHHCRWTIFFDLDE